jgi:hypothetical protein
LGSIAKFAGATDLSFRKTAGDATFKFVSELIDLGISARQELGETVCAAEILDRFSEKAVRTMMIRVANEQFETHLAQLEEVRFVNLSVDSGTVHSLTAIHCLVSNPFSLQRPIVFDLCPNFNFTKSDYASLFQEVIHKLTVGGESARFAHSPVGRIVISAVVIDNLRAQAAGFAMFQAMNPQHAAIVHLHCFAHMLNLVISSPRDADCFSHLVSRLFPFHVILRKRAARTFLGKICPSLIPSRWLYMVDILDFFLQNRRQINSYLLIQHELDPFIPLSIPKEFFELHAILLPFHIMLAAVESRDCTLSEIVPLFREVQANVRTVFGVLDTETSKQILHIILARFYARLLTNNYQEAIAAYLLTPLGRDELRTEQEGYHTIRMDVRLPIWRPARDSRSERTFETTIVELTNAILNARVLRDAWPDPWQDADPEAINEDADPSLDDLESRSEDDDEPEEESENDDTDETQDPRDENEGILRSLTMPGLSALSQQYARTLQQFKAQSLQSLLSFSVYRDLYTTAERFLVDYGRRIDPETRQSESVIRQFRDDWLFGDPNRLPFRWETETDPNLIWRRAHLSEEWMNFADLALRLISISTSEADCERSLSIQRDIVGAHGTQYKTPSLAARLRLHEPGRTKHPAGSPALIKPIPSVRDRRDAQEHQLSVEKQDDVLAAELSSDSGQSGANRPFKTGDLYLYSPDSSRSGVLARVICECGDDAILLMGEHDSRLYQVQKANLRLVGEEETSAEKSIQDQRPVEGFAPQEKT